MNRTNLNHALIALAMQFITVVIMYQFGLIPTKLMPAVGALPGVFFYIGREFTQWETRKRFRERAWDSDSTYDLLAPMAATISVAIVAFAIL